jgi:hypothetical protein
MFLAQESSSNKLKSSRKAGLYTLNIKSGRLTQVIKLLNHLVYYNLLMHCYHTKIYVRVNFGPQRISSLSAV